VCVFRGLDWENGKAFGIMLSLGSTHTPLETLLGRRCAILRGAEPKNQDPNVYGYTCMC